MPNADIVPITEAHIASYNTAVGVVAREGNFLSILDAFPMESTREYVRGNIAQGYPHFVAVTGEQVIGWCDINSVSDREVHRHCGLLGMGLVAEYRRRGIGQRLITAAIDAAQRRGFLRIELKVRATNQAAIALYEKAGFALEGTLRKEWCANGQYCDSHVMALLFPPLA